MFYSTDLLSQNNGKFAAIWLAGVYGKNIKKILSLKQILKVNISQACHDVEYPNVRLSLRLQSNLLIGILRVYKEQVYHISNVMKYAWKELRTLNIDMRLIDLYRPTLSVHAVTLPDPVTHPSPLDDFPEDIFSISPSQVYPRLEQTIRADDSATFIRVAGQSPTTPVPPHTPEIGPHQAPKEKITMKEPEWPDKPMEIFGDELPAVMSDDEEDMMIGDLKRPISLPGLPVVEPEDQEVQIIDSATGELRSPETEERGRKRERPFPGSMVTPGEGIEQLDVLERPRKRRKRLKKDLYRKLSDQKMISNLANVNDIVRDRPFHFPLRKSAKELLNNPSRPELRSLPFINMWRENAGPRPIPDDDDVQLPGAEAIRYERESQGPEESYERSRQSEIADMQTPSTTLTPGQPDTSFEQSRPGSRIEISQQLPSIQELEIDPGIEVPISPIGEVPGEAEEEDFATVLHRRVTHCMGDGEKTTFSTVFPTHIGTTKGLAAEGLFNLLELHRQGVIVLAQPEGTFSEIHIARGRNF